MLYLYINIYMDKKPKENIENDGLNSNNKNLTDKKLNIKIQSILDKWWLPEDLVERLRWLSNSDLNILFTKFYSERSKSIWIKSIFSQFDSNKVCHANKEKIRETHLIESEINKNLPEYYELLNISPFTPFWLTSFLTKNNQKKILTISRWYDVGSDGSISLAMESAKRLKSKNRKHDDSVFLATHYECPRWQFFYDKENPPHFRIFFSSVAGRVDKNDWNYNFEKMALHDIFSVYFNLLRNLICSGSIEMKNIEIIISDMAIVNNLFKHDNANLSNDEIKEKIWMFRSDQISNKYSNDLLKYLNIGLPDKYININDIDMSFVEKYGLQDNMKYLKNIYEILDWIIQEFKDLDIDIKIDISRTKWVGCYDRWAFRIEAENAFWKKMEIADLWFNDWTQKLLSDKKQRLLVWWLWTDRIAQKFRK